MDILARPTITSRCYSIGRAVGTPNGQMGQSRTADAWDLAEVIGRRNGHLPDTASRNPQAHSPGPDILKKLAQFFDANPLALFRLACFEEGDEAEVDPEVSARLRALFLEIDRLLATLPREVQLKYFDGFVEATTLALLVEEQGWRASARSVLRLQGTLFPHSESRHGQFPPDQWVSASLRSQSSTLH
jgi:hypothetical protein